MHAGVVYCSSRARASLKERKPKNYLPGTLSARSASHRAVKRRLGTLLLAQQKCFIKGNHQHIKCAIFKTMEHLVRAAWVGCAAEGEGGRLG